MLRKLIKHELIATARTMLPIFAAVLLTALGTHFAAFSPSRIPASVPAWLAALAATLFVFSIFAAFAAAFVLMLRRFYSNLLRDEGYLTMTLPVSVHEHIATKLIVSVLWSLLTMLVVGSAFMVLFLEVSWVGDMFVLMGDVIKTLGEENLLLHGVGIGLELLTLMSAGIASVCLQFYAAMAIGHSFTSRKGLCSFAAYLVLHFALQAAYNLIARIVGDTNIISATLDWLESTTIVTTFENGVELVAPSFAGMHVFLLSSIAILLLQGAVYYAVTAYFLKNRLNLN